MTFEGASQATTLDGEATKMTTQTIARGPVAALVAIKQLGTNGGGFFGPNSAHPYENPIPWSNLLEVVLDRRPADVLAGHVRSDAQGPRHAMVIYGVMLAFLLVGIDRGRSSPKLSPARPSRGCRWPGGRTWRARRSASGRSASATWAAITTATSNGSVNSMHDSLNPIAGMVPMANMMLNVVFSGIGAGFLNMLCTSSSPCSSPG